MFVIVNMEGKFWDGYGWNARGKTFCTIGGATRSLHEEGESPEFALFIPIEKIENATTEKLPTRDSEIAKV